MNHLNIYFNLKLKQKALIIFVLNNTTNDSDNSYNQLLDLNHKLLILKSKLIQSGVNLMPLNHHLIVSFAGMTDNNIPMFNLSNNEEAIIN